jgi:nucleoid-associated protein YgaU
MLKEKYQDLLSLATKLNVQAIDVREDSGKLTIKGTTTYQMQKDMLWDKIKSYAGWDKEVAADIKTEKTDIYGVYTVTGGDTLGKIAKQYLGDPKRYMDIFNANKDVLTNPDLIKVGQNLKIPNK